MSINPCQRCGACCAIYRVSFPSTETDKYLGGTVPADQTVDAGASRSAMRGTEMSPRRCIALQGVIGDSVVCSIYSNRPSTCKSFMAAWQSSVSGAQCNRARGCYGLTPFRDY